MPGHRREYDGQFAQIEVGFILNDPRCTGMTSPEFRYYIFVWCLAVKERMELLPKWWDAASLQRHCSLDTRTARKCRANLLQKCILEETANGRLRVCGVKSKHPNLKWKDEGLSESKGPLMVAQSETETETEIRNRSKNARVETDPKKKTDKEDGYSEAYRSFILFVGNKDNWKKIKVLLSMLEYNELVDQTRTVDQVNELRDHVIAGEMAAYLQTNSEDALDSLAKFDNGNWLNYIRRWLRRSLLKARAGGPIPSAYKDPMTADQERKQNFQKAARGLSE